MYEIPIYEVQLVRDSGVAQEREQVAGPDDSGKILNDFLATADREKFCVVMLDAKLRVIGINVASVGLLSSAPAHPREVFKPAILANASAIVVGHNHPSGELDPSDQDIAISNRLKDAGEVLGIEVLDSVIVDGTGGVMSLKEAGVL
jgi:DNA repair protein RadC